VLSKDRVLLVKHGGGVSYCEECVGYHVLNKETLNSMELTEKGIGLTTYNSVDEMMRSIK